VPPSLQLDGLTPETPVLLFGGGSALPGEFAVLQVNAAGADAARPLPGVEQQNVPFRGG